MGRARHVVGLPGSLELDPGAMAIIVSFAQPESDRGLQDRPTTRTRIPVPAPCAAARSTWRPGPGDEPPTVTASAGGESTKVRASRRRAGRAENPGPSRSLRRRSPGLAPVLTFATVTRTTHSTGRLGPTTHSALLRTRSGPYRAVGPARPGGPTQGAQQTKGGGAPAQLPPKPGQIRPTCRARLLRCQRSMARPHRRAFRSSLHQSPPA
jgi:hypothetical protein